MKIFVTVGTTSFDRLVKSITENETLQILKERSYTQMLLQIGRGTVEPQASDIDVTVDYYRYKTSIAEDISNSDLIVSHAGAGSCLEVLGAGKPLVVVINEDLMSNHQSELAEKLHSDGHLLYCTCKTLKETLKNMNLKELKPLPAAKTNIFASFLNTVIQT